MTEHLQSLHLLAYLGALLGNYSDFFFIVVTYLKTLIHPESKSSIYGWEMEQQQASKYFNSFIRLEETKVTPEERLV